MTSFSTPVEAADHRLAADPHELVHGAKAAEIGVVLHLDMAAQRRVVGHDHAVADLAVVRDVDRCHEQPAVADPRDAAAAGRAGVHGDVLADLVVAADHQLGSLAAILAVLRPMPETGEGEHAAAARRAWSAR